MSKEIVNDERTLLNALEKGGAIDSAALSSISIDNTLLLIHNDRLRTPLSLAVSNKDTHTIEYLLDKNAAQSIFVKGKAPNSLHCTLSKTDLGTAKSIISSIDNSLYNYVEELDKVNLDAAVGTAAAGTVIASDEVSVRTAAVVKSAQVPICDQNHAMKVGTFFSERCNSCKRSIDCMYQCTQCNYSLCSSCTTDALATGRTADAPKNITIPSDPFEVGDLVFLNVDKSKLSKLSDSKEAKGVFGESKLNLAIVVQATRSKAHSGSSSGSASGGGEPDWLVSVAGCSSTALPNVLELPSSDLTYGDYSTTGIYKSIIKPIADAPLIVGDRVCLSSSFPLQDGWCLGSLTDKKVGVVAYVPPSATGIAAGKNNEDRCIYVVQEKEDIYSDDDIALADGGENNLNVSRLGSTGYLFKASWLEKAVSGPIPAPLTVIKKGQRVVRSIEDWLGKGIGGSLGRPQDGKYGIVLETGPVRNNVQRCNFVVVVPPPPPTALQNMAAGDPIIIDEDSITFTNPMPSTKLAYAHPFIVSGDYYPNAHWKSSCVLESVTKVLADIGLKVDASILISRFKDKIWDQLYILCAHKGKILEFFQHFEDWLLSSRKYPGAGGKDSAESANRWLLSYERAVVDAASSKLDKMMKKSIKDYFGEEGLPSVLASLSSDHTINSNASGASDIDNDRDIVEQVKKILWTCKVCAFEDNKIDDFACACCGSAGQKMQPRAQLFFGTLMKAAASGQMTVGRVLMYAALSDAFSTGYHRDREALVNRFKMMSQTELKNIYLARKLPDSLTVSPPPMVSVRRPQRDDLYPFNAKYTEWFTWADYKRANGISSRKRIKEAHNIAFKREFTLHPGFPVLFRSPTGQPGDPWSAGVVKQVVPNATDGGEETYDVEVENGGELKSVIISKKNIRYRFEAGMDVYYSDSTAAAKICDGCGSPTVLSGDAKGAYAYWSCNGCNRSSRQERWFCAKCQNDWCFGCHPKSTLLTSTKWIPAKLLEVHDELTDNPSYAVHLYIEGLSDKVHFVAIDTLDNVGLVPRLPWLVAASEESENKPPSRPCCDKDHELVADSTALDDWNCNRCTKTGQPKTTAHWHCAECSFNCCYDCQAMPVPPLPPPLLQAVPENSQSLLIQYPKLVKKLVYKENDETLVDIFYDNGSSDLGVETCQFDIYTSFKKDKSMMTIEIDGAPKLDTESLALDQVDEKVEEQWNHQKQLIVSEAAATGLNVSENIDTTATAAQLGADNKDNVDFTSNTSLMYFEAISNIDDLVSFHDVDDGNYAVHYAFHLGFVRTAAILLRCGASRWSPNNNHVPPNAIADGVADLSSSEWSETVFKLYKTMRKKSLLPNNLMRIVMQTPLNYATSESLTDLVEALFEMKKEESVQLAEEAVSKYEDSLLSSHTSSMKDALVFEFRHAYVYKALALLDAGFGARAAQNEMDCYFASFGTDSNSGNSGSSSGGSGQFDPLAFYVMYLLWKEEGMSKRKQLRIRAAHCLACFRCFSIAQDWMEATDDVDIQVAKEGIDKDYNEDEDEDEDEDDADEEGMCGPPDPSDPEEQWKVAKNRHKLESVSMDKLMALTGMREVKLRAITVCKEVLLAKRRPAHIKATVSMNFLFVGNPGTGKTTVATLLSAAMVELGYRKNKTPVLTSANEILADQDPVALFQKLIESADNGTIFIDEAYNFNPAPPGSTANPSNKVLDHLMLVSETKRETMTFILAGYKDEIMNLLTYNPGFPSRFPKDFTFEFSDYSDTQLRKIFVGMVKERGMRLQPKKECGVSLSNVVAQRIGKGRGRKGFGNAREVRVRMEACIVEQMDRLGSLELIGKKISDKDYATLTRGDVIGDRPDLENSPALLELDKMIGLAKVKSTVRGLMNLQLQNYDNEMRDDKVQSISLHRVFFGNAGTGKTTVARIYGRLLKEFGFLSDGDIIEVKPSDLIGQAMGESSTKTAAIIASAKGKVLFIDEAYGLDPTRNSGSYGSQCLDTLVEKIDGNAGVDMAVIMAGYEPQMRALFKNADNQGLTRRFNLDEAWEFEDFSDADLKKVLLSLIRSNELMASNTTVNLAVSLIAQRRRLDGFGNAAECSTILDRAKLHLASRKQAAVEARRKRDMALSGRANKKPAGPKRGGGGGSHNNFLIASAVGEDASSVPSLRNASGEDGQNSDNDGIPTEDECTCDPYLLIDEDFVNVTTSAQGARDALADLENMDNVLELLQDLEDTIAQAKTEGISAAKILDDCHMLFTGPPGTGKTTVAQRFGTMFRQLELLPTDHVEVVTAGNLLSRYMGGTAPNVVEAMRKAKGGILFVDEAYGMLPKNGSYGADAIQAFIDNITLPEFLGNIIIIFAGYQEDVEQLFNINPGFRSRFDKKRLVFNSWSADQATQATIKAAEQQHGYGMTAAAKEELQDMYERLSSLPDWGSAREVYKLILPAMYSKRARRLGQKQRMEKLAAAASTGAAGGDEAAVGGSHIAVAAGGTSTSGGSAMIAKGSRRAAARASQKPAVPPYEVQDVREAFTGPITDRGGSMDAKRIKVPRPGQPSPSTEPTGPSSGETGAVGSNGSGGGGNSNELSAGGTDDNNNESNRKKGSLKGAVGRMKAASAFTNAIGSSLKQYDLSLDAVTEMSSLDELHAVTQAAKEEDRLLIIAFSASWVKDTERVDLDDFAPKNPKVMFRSVMHSEATRNIFAECGVTDMRVFIVFFRGKLVERLADQMSTLVRRIAYWGKKCSNGKIAEDDQKSTSGN